MALVGQIMRTVVAPIGGAGNHVRWLCLLDKSFDLKPISKTSATNFEFILNTVYNEKRNNDNWLEIEFIWRENLVHLIDLYNDIEFIKDFDNKKFLYVCSPGEKCYEHYFKFSKKNKKYQDRMHENKEQWIKEVDTQNDNITTLLPNPFILHFGKYYTENIDEKLLDQLNGFFNINIPYAEADIVHKRWIELNSTKRST